MTDEELKSTVIALQLRWHGAYAVGTTPARLWFAVPVDAPDARLEADDPMELETLIRADNEARVLRRIRATAGVWGGNASC
jgi:hypothetical protein